MFQKRPFLRADFSKSIYGKKHLESVSLLISKSKSRIDISLPPIGKQVVIQKTPGVFARLWGSSQNYLHAILR